MQFKCIDKGIFGSNCYIVWNENCKDAIIIDAGVPTTILIEELNTLGLSLKYILFTHNHFDHMAYVKAIKEATGAKSAIHKDDAPGFSNSDINGSALFGEAMTYGQPDILLEDGDIIEACDLKFKVIHTPGHSAGSCSIKVENCVFTGDTLFYGSIGRTDLPTSNPKAIIDSIKNRLYTLPKDTKIYPGHGSSTTIGFEIDNNLVMKSFGG